VIVNNAGTFAFASLEKSSEELVRAQFESNVFGPTFVAQATMRCGFAERALASVVCADDDRRVG
jgi:NAD(P)-dependent dehydrogenase (short-subunit alcohol dehydrogenase family)